MDIVYLCRDGKNEELRYSLRSLANAPHDRVWVFGGCPEWLDKTKVTHVKVEQVEFSLRTKDRVKFENTRRNLYTAATHPEVAKNFVLMNDDFFVTAPITEWPVLHFGPPEAFQKWFRARQSVPSSYVLAEIATLDWCREKGVQRPLSYALHVPLPIVKDRLAEILEDAPWDIEGYPLHMRSAYGNLNGIGGVQVSDVKVERGTKTGTRRMNGVRIAGPVIPTKTLPKPFASSSDRSFQALAVGTWIRDLFPEASPYERA